MSVRARAAAAFAAELVAETFALVIAAYYSMSTDATVIDPDIWWHIRVGDWIASHWSVPRVGILSQHIERPWIAYSWGFDVLVSRVHRVYGLQGIPSLTICLQVLISFVFLVAIRRLAKGAWWSWLIAALSIYAFYVNPLRPLLLTLLFFTVELAILFDAERRKDDRLLFWMAPLLLVWANVHIQFVYGMFVFGLYIATRLLTKGSRATLVGALAAALVCSCIGPNWAWPYGVAINYATHPAQYQIIQEMAAINFRRPEHYVQLLLVMAACVALGRQRRLDLFRSLLLLSTAMVSFRSMRDSWFVSMAAGFVIAEAVGQARLGDAAEDTTRRPIRPVMQYALAAMLALGVSFGFAIQHGLSTPALIAAIDRVYPIRATQFVGDMNLPGPIYNDFNWGGFVIFNLPGQPVSVDPRVDLYGDELVIRSIRTANAERGWQTDPDLVRANVVLMQRWYPLAAALAADPHFRQVYQDPLAVVFVRQP